MEFVIVVSGAGSSSWKRWVVVVSRLGVGVETLAIAVARHIRGSEVVDTVIAAPDAFIVAIALPWWWYY